MTDKPRIRNISDLARLAGVSTGTVSRALTGAGLISQKTRDRIQALAREHDFRPNVMARNLRIQRTGAIGVLIPLGHETGQHISDPFFITMLGLLADSLTERGYDLMLRRVIPTDERWLDDFADSGRTDGIIIIGQSNQFEVIEALAARYKPLVVWGGHQPGQKHCAVGTDNLAGGRLAAERLIAQGCKRIAFFGEAGAIELAQRFEGCRAALADAGLQDGLEQFPAHLTADDDAQAMARFLSDPATRPDGIFAASDVIAMTVLRVLAERGIAIPDDMKLIGFDGLALGEQTVPRLSTIRQDLTAGADALVDLLLRRINGEEPESVVLAPELLVRMSG